MLAQKMRCSGTWTHFCLHAVPLDSPSAQRKRSPHTNFLDPTIIVKGQKLQTVDKFTYIGSTLSRNVLIDDEVDARIAKASTAYGRLRKNVWDRQILNLQTKLKVYKAVVMTTNACETWTVYCRHARKLNRLHINCMLRITWQDMIQDTEVLKRAGLQSIYALLYKIQLRRAGHVVKMSAGCMKNCQRGGGILAVNTNGIETPSNLP